MKHLVTAFLIIVSFSLFAQGGAGPFPDDGEPCGFPLDPCPVPVDGGVGFLIAAGLVYGGKKIKDSRSNSN